MNPLPEHRVEVHYGGRAMRCFVDRPAHLDAMFREIAARHGDREALVFESTRLDYRALDARVDRCADGLVASGVRRGDRVALFAGNHDECIVALLAIVRSGAICVPIGIRQQKAELAFILRQSGARVLIFDAASAARVPAGSDMPSVELLFACDGMPADLAPFDRDVVPFSRLEARCGAVERPAIDEDDTAFLMYTSGTTGFPKGAMLSHVGFWHTLRHYQLGFGYRPGDRSLLAIPASHISGLLACVYVMFSIGGCVVVQREFNARQTLALIESERITATIFVPSIYNLLLRCPDFDRFDLSTHWRIGHFGGAPMPEATVAALNARLPTLELLNGYGATETSSAATLMPYGDGPAHSDSIGKPVPLATIRIVDGDGREVATGGSGELWISGPAVIPGYWDNPEANARSFVDGAWRSGDIGSIDADGYVRLLDRIKDMINRAGYKIYSVEVENALNAHPAVVECAVVPHPDPVLGERVHAFVSVRDDGDPAALVDRLRAHCAARLADYKVPDFISIEPGLLVRNANGKLQKSVYRERVGEG